MATTYVGNATPVPSGEGVLLDQMLYIIVRAVLRLVAPKPFVKNSHEIRSARFWLLRRIAT